MGPNDWAGDQCDMTLVGGFSRQGGGISAVLFKVRGGATGSAEQRRAGSVGRPLQNINVRSEQDHSHTRVQARTHMETTTLPGQSRTTSDNTVRTVHLNAFGHFAITDWQNI